MTQPEPQAVMAATVTVSDFRPGFEAMTLYLGYDMGEALNSMAKAVQMLKPNTTASMTVAMMTPEALKVFFPTEENK